MTGTREITLSAASVPAPPPPAPVPLLHPHSPRAQPAQASPTLACCDDADGARSQPRKQCAHPLGAHNVLGGGQQRAVLWVRGGIGEGLQQSDAG